MGLHLPGAEAADLSPKILDQFPQGGVIGLGAFAHIDLLPSDSGVIGPKIDGVHPPIDRRRVPFRNLAQPTAVLNKNFLPNLLASLKKQFQFREPPSPLLKPNLCPLHTLPQLLLLVGNPAQSLFQLSHSLSLCCKHIFEFKRGLFSSLLICLGQFQKLPKVFRLGDQNRNSRSVAAPLRLQFGDAKPARVPIVQCMVTLGKRVV